MSARGGNTLRTRAQTFIFTSHTDKHTPQKKKKKEKEMLQSARWNLVVWLAGKNLFLQQCNQGYYLRGLRIWSDGPEHSGPSVIKIASFWPFKVTVH